MILYIFIYLLKKKNFIKFKKLKIISKFGNIPDCTIPGNMSTSQSTQSTQNTATTSFTSTSDVFELSELKKYRNYWWKTGQMHSKARWEEAT